MKVQFVQGKPIFTDLNKVPIQYKYLVEDKESEVIIVGGGVTGAILGYYFSKNGISSVLLEKGRIAHGSTSITTALLQYELDEMLNSLLQYTSYENIITSYKLDLKALDEIKEFIKVNGNECNYVERDCLLYTDKKLEEKELYEEYKARKSNGFDVEFITEENNPLSIDLKAGIYSKSGGAELDPYKFTHQLFKVAVNNGLDVYENTEVIKINHNEDKVEVITEYGHKVSGKIVIIATGYNTKRFTNREFGVTTNTYNIVTKPIRNIIGWENNILIRDIKDPYNYYRTTIDNRIIAGGCDVPFIPGAFDESAAQEKYNNLKSKLIKMFPKIDCIEIEYKYCGAFTSTQDNLCYIGKDPNKKRQWYCLGYGANGILFAILGGIMLSKLYIGEADPNLKLFKVDRFDK